MKLRSLWVVVFVFIFQATVVADDDARKEAEILLSSIKMEKVLDSSIEQMLAIQIKQKPALAPFKEVMLKFLKKHMSFEILKPDMITIYTDAFTASELKDINDFYQTPTGVKTLKLLPSIMAKGGELGARRVQENLPELQAMLKAEVQRIKAEKAEK